MLARHEVQSYEYSFAGLRLRWCSQVASSSASASFHCEVSGASSSPGEGRKIQDALLARVKANRVEFVPRTTLSSLADGLNDGRLPDGEVAANLESAIRKLYKVGGRRFRWRFCRQRFLRGGSPACG